jgi:hypothetical protein
MEAISEPVFQGNRHQKAYDDIHGWNNTDFKGIAVK